MTYEQRRQFCARLRALRLRAGLTPKALAARIGRTVAHWYNIERGDSLPTLDVLARFSRVVGAPMRDCFAWVQP